MSGFSSAWLALREPADHRARSAALAARLAAWLRRGGTARVIDLGCGTGSNLRWLAPRLERPQRWCLLDNDRALLRTLPQALGRWGGAHGPGLVAGSGGALLGEGLQVEWRRHDLRAGLPPGAAADLVSASALADLVSRDWLLALAARCAGAGSALLLALDYDGRVALDPAEPLDAAVRDALNRHQLGDKGFGPALGPGASAAAAAALAAHGYRVAQAPSDWRLGPEEAGLQEALVDGWCAAVAETGRIPGEDLDRWRARRLDAIRGGGLSVRVGHADLLALPPAAPR